MNYTENAIQQLNNSRVLVIGGTGSVGSALVKYLAKNTSARITVFSRDETKQYEMGLLPELKEQVDFVLGDIRDLRSVQKAVNKKHYVFHCAALKHVPFCEKNVDQAVRTNVIGTSNIVDAILDTESVKKLIVCSTDKAASPTTTMGASKLLQERLVQNTEPRTSEQKFMAVRLGNLFESRGSVFHLFFKQRESGVLTLTHKDMTRFISKVENVVDTMMFAVAEGEHGDVIIRNCIAVNMANVAVIIAPNADIHFTGIRQNEKLHELLFSASESKMINVKQVDSESGKIVDYFVLNPYTNVEESEESANNDYSSETRALDLEYTREVISEFAKACGYTL